jgi:ATP-dependent RNA helicase DOB1
MPVGGAAKRAADGPTSAPDAEPSVAATTSGLVASFEAAGSGAPPSKAAKLAVGSSASGGVAPGDRVAQLPTGANMVEVNGKSCTHEVAWPPGEEGSPLPPPPRPGPPAREYPFTIDPFQQVAVNCLEAGALRALLP